MVRNNPNKSKKKRDGLRIIIILCVFAALAGGGFYFHQSSSGSPNADIPVAIAIETGNIEDVVTAQGKLEPKDYVDVGVQVSGQLKKLHVDIGDTVKARDLLAEIDLKVYEARVILSRQLYDSGAVDFQTLLNAQDTLLSAEDRYSSIRLEALSAAIDLYKALGGGWEGAA